MHPPGPRLPALRAGDPEAHPLLGAAGYRLLLDSSFRWAHPRPVAETGRRADPGQRSGERPAFLFIK
jgi:hypothetical protein